MAYLNGKKIFSVVQVKQTGSNLQNKITMFAIQDQLITPDQGYDGLSQVEIAGLTGRVRVYDSDYEMKTISSMNIEENNLNIIIPAEPNADYLDLRLKQTDNYTYENYNVTSIPSYAFYLDNRIISASFPNVEIIGTYSFQYCSRLASVNFPNLTTIGGSGLRNCSSLTSVNFPSVTTIAGQAMRDCGSLTSLTLGANQVCVLGATDGIPAKATQHMTIYVPSSLISSYQTATNWATLYNNGYIDFVAISE